LELKQGAIVATRFRLVRELGKGGMGAVWLAQHTALDIPCAVKFIHAQAAQNPEARARFEREAKAAAALRSPFVVQILDHGVCDGTPYIAMEFLEGEPLNVRLLRVGRLDARETFRVISQVGRALSKAHSVGVVHRDLKPENVFLVSDEDTEITKVLDFGVAKQASDLTNATQTGALLGTPKYMSPEQAQGSKNIDSRADLWSLGVLTYRCLTGKLPFDKEALLDVLLEIVSAPLPVPTQQAPGIPQGFDEWWQRAAQRDPGQRFQAAKEMVEALAVALNVSLPAAGDLTPQSLMSPSGLPIASAAPSPASQPQPPDSSGMTTPLPGYLPQQAAVPASSAPPSGSMAGPTGPHSAGPISSVNQPAPWPAGPVSAAPETAAATMGGVLKGTAAAPSSASRRVVLGIVIAAVVTGGLVAGLFVGGVFGGSGDPQAGSSSQAASTSLTAQPTADGAEAKTTVAPTAAGEATGTATVSATPTTSASASPKPVARPTPTGAKTTTAKAKTPATVGARPPVPVKPKPSSTRPNLGF